MLPNIKKETVEPHRRIIIISRFLLVYFSNKPSSFISNVDNLTIL